MILKLSLILLSYNCVVSSQECATILDNFCFGDDWPHAAAHGTHSMDLFEMRYFFEPGAAEVNNVPVGTMDLTSPDLVLPHAPDIHGNNSFGTPAMYSLDLILSNWENDFFLMRGATPLEKIIHNLHMYEGYRVAGQMYKELKKRKNKNAMKKFCPCITDRQTDVEERIEEIMKTFQTSGTGQNSWRRRDYGWIVIIIMMKRHGHQLSTKCKQRMEKFGMNGDLPQTDNLSENSTVPELVSSDTWAVWKPQMLVPMSDIWNYQLAHYLYCRLNMI